MGAVSITGGGYANAGEPGDAIRLLGIAWEIVDYGRIHRGSILQRIHPRECPSWTPRSEDPSWDSPWTPRRTDLNRTPVIRAMRVVGFTCNLTRRRSQHEAQELLRRTDHLDPQGTRGWRLGPDLARRHSVAENTVYRWKSKYGGMEISVTVPLEQSHLDCGSFAVMPLARHRQPEAVCQGIDAV